MTKVLVVDGDAAILDVIFILLSENNYEVSCSSAGDIIAQIAQLQPDLILIDHFYSEAGEKSLCRQIKLSNQYMHIPVLLMSTQNNAAFIAKSCGADDFIHKPFDITAFLKKVSDLADNLTIG